MTSMRAHRRRGFILLSVLWVITGVAILGMGAMLAARESVYTGRNRLASERAVWRAEGCVERIRAAIDAALDDQRRSAETWRALDDRVPAHGLEGCNSTLTSSGMALDINVATAREWYALLTAAGVGEVTQDSLVDAIADWTDGDDIPRRSGAERSWYREDSRPVPRNARIAAVKELRLVRGFADLLDEHPRLEKRLTVDATRIDLGHAPLEIVSGLPGVSPELADVLTVSRQRGDSFASLSQLLPRLSPAARDTFFAHQAELSARTSNTPDAWILASSVSEGTPAITETVEVWLVLGGRRAAIVRRTHSR